MRGYRAKALMAMVRFERKAELKVVDRDLVIDKVGRVRNSPDSLRAMYLKVKTAFVQAVREVGRRVHFEFSEEAYTRYLVRMQGKPAGKSRLKKTGLYPAPKNSRRGDVAAIQKPLNFIASQCPPEQVMGRDELGRPAVEYIPHPTLVKARRAANAGNGAEVRRIARSLLAA